MNRFLKTSVVLLIAIFALVTGVDATLDHMTRSASQNSFNWYDERGESVVSFEGNLAECHSYLKPGPVGATSLLHHNNFGPHPVD